MERVIIIRVKVVHECKENDVIKLSFNYHHRHEYQQNKSVIVTYEKYIFDCQLFRQGFN